MLNSKMPKQRWSNFSVALKFVAIIATHKEYLMVAWLADTQPPLSLIFLTYRHLSMPFLVIVIALFLLVLYNSNSFYIHFAYSADDCYSTAEADLSVRFFSRNGWRKCLPPTDFNNVLLYSALSCLSPKLFSSTLVSQEGRGGGKINNKLESG